MRGRVAEGGSLTRDHWSHFWTEHAESSAGEHDQVRVLRTVQRQPIDDGRFAEILADLTEKLRLRGNEHVLDLCCGNGLIARHLAPRCARVVGVDFCDDFVAAVNALEIPNLEARVSDVAELRFDEREFDRVLLYAALQYFDPAESLRLMKSIFDWLRPGGSVLFGDIPDSRRMWRFFDDPARQKAYFDGVSAGSPIIGTWFDSEWLEKAAAVCGFAGSEVLEQPPASPNAHYRFDMLLTKSESPEQT